MWKGLKKGIAMTLSLMMVFSITGCSTKSDAESQTDGSAIYKEGTYQSTAKGFGGDMTVSVTVSSSAITAIKIDAHSETDGVGTRAIDELPSTIVDKQSTDVDMVSGATFSSKAIIEAVNAALKQADINGSTDHAAELKSGTYEVTTLGKKGAMKVAVTIADNKISDIAFLEHRETEGICDVPMAQLPAAIIANQTVDVDTISGATSTSLAIIDAVKQAITQAGGDVAAFNKSIDQAAPSTNVVEENVDVVVAGGGPAGLMAAMTAAEAGQNVLVLEKLPYVGGNLLAAAGHISAAGSKMHEAINFEGMQDKYKSADAYLQSRIDTADKDGKYYTEDPVMTRKFFNLNVDLVNMLIDRGVEFVEGTKSVSHVLAPGDFKGTGKFAKWLVNNIEAAGGRIITEATVTELMQQDGKVTGVVAVGADGTTYKVNAKATMLMTGGFTSNKELIAANYPELANLSSTAQISTLGDGMKMAQAVGADVHAMDTGVHKMYLTSKSQNEIPFFLFYTDSMIVNANGERFVDEMGNYSINSGEMLKPENGGYSYFIFDETDKPGVEKDYMGLFELGDIVEYNSIQEMADALNTPKLPDTIAEFNKTAQGGRVVEDGKVYAMKVEPGLYLTYGGVKSDMDMRAVKADGSPIEGLYLAGDILGSIEVQEGTRYTAGVTQALTFGKVAAETAMKDIK